MSDVFGVGVVQNEADILRESLSWALRFCQRIWIWDLGSTDGTQDVLASFPNQKVCWSTHSQLRFRSSLKGKVFEQARPEIPPGSWVYIFDADEFLEGNLAAALSDAEQREAEKVGVWQANFYPTIGDLEKLRQLGEANWCALPITERLRFYRLEWFEWRLLRVSDDFSWDTTGVHSRWARGNRELRAYRGHTLFVRHYRYRSPHQVELRHTVRQHSPVEGYGQFRYDRSARFEDYVRPRWQLRYWKLGAPWHVPQYEIVRAQLQLLLWRAYRRTTRHRHQD